MEVDAMSFALVVQAAVIIFLLYALVRSNQNLAVSFPASALGLFDAALGYAREKAALTPSKLDDEAINVLEGVVRPFAEANKSDPPAAG